MGGCPMAALALALSVAVSGGARVGHSMLALQRRGAAAANLADYSCASAARSARRRCSKQQSKHTGALPCAPVAAACTQPGSSQPHAVCIALPCPRPRTAPPIDCSSLASFNSP